MGDGNNYAHYEQQLEIKCESCHVDQNKEADKNPGLTRKNNKMDNIQQKDDKFVLVNKFDEKKLHPLNPVKNGVCNDKNHLRLGCESCHSPWVPQCYGCHVKQDMRETHLDKLTLKETPGWWEEGRSYLRYERPMLAIWHDQVVIVTPGCQDVVTLIDENGNEAGNFNRLTMAAINPHTTQRKGRSCADCHASPKTLGLGEGTVWREDEKWHFSSLNQGIQTEAGPTPPLDSYVTIDGKPLQNSSRADLRPFNKKELARILRIGLCIECHTKYDDTAYRDYSPKTRCTKK